MKGSSRIYPRRPASLFSSVKFRAWNILKGVKISTSACNLLDILLSFLYILTDVNITQAFSGYLVLNICDRKSDYIVVKKDGRTWDEKTSSVCNFFIFEKYYLVLALVFSRLAFALVWFYLSRMGKTNEPIPKGRWLAVIFLLKVCVCGVNVACLVWGRGQIKNG